MWILPYMEKHALLLSTVIVTSPCIASCLSLVQYRKFSSARYIPRLYIDVSLTSLRYSHVKDARIWDCFKVVLLASVTSLRTQNVQKTFVHRRSWQCSFLLHYLSYDVNNKLFRLLDLLESVVLLFWFCQN